MPAKRIVIDGPRGMVKSTLLDALKYRLNDDDISSSTSQQLGLLDCLVNSPGVQATHKAGLSNKVCLIDTSHIFELASDFYGSGKLADYELLSRAVELAAINLKPDLVVLINTLAGDPSQEKLEHGYTWEAHQRGYLVMSAIGDIEPVFEKILKLASASTLSGEPTAIKEILRKKPIAHKSKVQQKSSDDPRTTHSDRRRRRSRR